MANEAQRGRETIVQALRTQAGWCAKLASPLYAELLAAAADDAAAGGPAADVLEGDASAPPESALALRLAGAVHRLALEGRAPELARHYPSCGGAPGEPGAVWRAFRDVLRGQRDELRALVRCPVQTNEVGRSACLLPGFLAAARATGLPLRLLEVGASAGLNLRFDHYRYESGSFAFGDPRSPVRFIDFVEGELPAPAELRVAERAGVDAAPIDPKSAAGRTTLRAYLWPDQVERLARLDAALEVAARVPAPVERGDALDFVRSRAQPREGVASVVFHSIVMQYLGEEGARRFGALVAEAGERATPAAPLAWLRLEPVLLIGRGVEFRVTLTLWPGGAEQSLGVCSPHGPPLRVPPR